jgi:hypothetical protein
MGESKRTLSLGRWIRVRGANGWEGVWHPSCNASPMMYLRYMQRVIEGKGDRVLTCDVPYVQPEVDW